MIGRRLSQVDKLRRFTLPVLRWLGRDIRITHHWDGQAFRLHAYHHKGYWFHGQRREQATMLAFERLIAPDAVVAEIGAHIGYVTRWLAKLTPQGHVYAFEPGGENRRYLRANVARLSNVTVVPLAASDRGGSATLYVDTLTGQNSSLVPSFDLFAATAARGYDPTATTVPEEIATVTLDEYFAGKPLDFLKIDVEGAELSVLRGAERILTEDRPVLMLEVQADEPLVYDLVSALGYRVETVDGVVVDREAVVARQRPGGVYNVFCLPQPRQP